MSQDDLGATIGVQKASISAYEHSRHSPSLEGLLAIAELFEVSLDELVLQPLHEAPVQTRRSLSRAGEPPPPSYKKGGEQRELESLLRILTNTEQELHELKTRLRLEAPELAKAWGII